MRNVAINKETEIEKSHTQKVKNSCVLNVCKLSDYITALSNDSQALGIH